MDDIAAGRLRGSHADHVQVVSFVVGRLARLRRFFPTLGTGVCRGRKLWLSMYRNLGCVANVREQDGQVTLKSVSMVMTTPTPGHLGPLGAGRGRRRIGAVAFAARR